MHSCMKFFGFKLFCKYIQYIKQAKACVFTLNLHNSDSSQSDSSIRDFWMNMQAVTVYLKKLSEQNPAASYYNVDVLKYQVTLCIVLVIGGG